VIEPIFSAEEVLSAAETVKSIYVAASIKRYIVDLTHRTRVSGDVYLGASPRGSLALFRAGQARAALNGREHVLPDDIKALAQPILGHRIIVNPAARLREVTAERIVQEILLSSPVPGGSYSA
jgi:MoxR-like ATPase